MHLTNEPTKNEALPSINLLMLRWLGSQQINQHNLEFRTFLTCHKICENGKLCNFICANPFCDSKRFCSKQYLISFLLVLNILRCKKKRREKTKIRPSWKLGFFSRWWSVFKTKTERCFNFVNIFKDYSYATFLISLTNLMCQSVKCLTFANCVWSFIWKNTAWLIY